MIPGGSDITLHHITNEALPREGELRLCQVVRLSTIKPAGAWMVFVDGETGEALLVEDILRRFEGRGLVFNPDPKSSTGIDTLQDADDAAEAIPEAAYQEVSLPDLELNEDSLFTLTGPWVDTSPTAGRAGDAEGAFLFDRSDDRFEEVMGYYHIDRQARYMVDLGFEDVPPTPILLDINAVEEDASWYSPFSNTLTTGTGGVDDAEDADVLLHEYGHALIERIIPELRGGETALMGEGLCDFFAGDWSLEAAPDYHPMEVYNWDGHNEFWAGRVLDIDYRYSDLADHSEAHDGGQLWSSFLTAIRIDGGDRDLWMKVVLDHLYSVTDSITIPDAVQMLLMSDRELTEERFRELIIREATEREIPLLGYQSPRITHMPLRDREEVDAMIPIDALIESSFGPVQTSAFAIYRYGDDDFDTLTLQKREENDLLFGGEMPAPEGETDISYYLMATDQQGRVSLEPPLAPLNSYHFHVGPDRFAPVIVARDSLRDTVFPTGEMLVGATVTDNLGVEAVSLIIYNRNMEPREEFELISRDEEPDHFVGLIEWNARQDDVVYYRYQAIDAARHPNSAQSPRQSFRVTRNAVAEDFEGSVHRWDLTGWFKSDQDCYSGSWGLVDRVAGDQTPSARVATLSESWNFAGMGRARLTFMESHMLDARVGENCAVQIGTMRDEMVWETQLSLLGNGWEWRERELNLDRYAVRGASPIRIRFVTTTPEGAAPRNGVVIDELRLSVGNMVEVQEKESPLALSFRIGEPYPNPFNGSFSIEISSPAASRLILLDVAGREVTSLPIPTGLSVAGFDMMRFPAGAYWIQVDGYPSIVKPILFVK
jgi:hypothetical protein